MQMQAEAQDRAHIFKVPKNILGRLHILGES